jgi:hypothetical protein
VIDAFKGMRGHARIQQDAGQARRKGPAGPAVGLRPPSGAGAGLAPSPSHTGPGGLWGRGHLPGRFDPLPRLRRDSGVSTHLPRNASGEGSVEAASLPPQGGKAAHRFAAGLLRSPERLRRSAASQLGGFAAHERVPRSDSRFAAGRLRRP